MDAKMCIKKMIQWVKVLAFMPKELGSIPHSHIVIYVTHMGEGKG